MEADIVGTRFGTELELVGKVITIDGPAASGKTSVSRELAQRMGWAWVSTGAFYRGLALVAKKLAIDLQDEQALSQLATSSRWSVEMQSDSTRVIFDNQDVTDEIGQEDVGSIASSISHFPKVRTSLLEPQRRCSQKVAGLVAEGRDCGTVVFPNAECKVYLTADQGHRAERRAKELGLDKQQMQQAQSQRDKQDSTRKAAPLQVPSDALLLDTTSLNLKEVVDQVEIFARERLSQKK